jgi:hypothetical protein
MPESPPEGPIEHVTDWFRAHVEAGAGNVAADVSAALRDHAQGVFEVSSGILSVLKMIDPADAPLITAAQALEPKIYAMAERAAALAAAALKGS